MTGINWTDVLARGAKTFVAAFLAVVPVAAVTTLDYSTLKAGALAGVAAVITVVWNILLQWSSSE